MGIGLPAETVSLATVDTVDQPDKRVDVETRKYEDPDSVLGHEVGQNVDHHMTNN